MSTTDKDNERGEQEAQSGVRFVTKEKPFFKHNAIPKGVPQRRVEDLSAEELQELRAGLRNLMLCIETSLLIAGEGLMNKH